MVNGSLALLYFLLGFHGGRQGSGPDRGRSPVEWGDFLSIRSFVRPSIRSPPWAIQPGLRPGWLGLRTGWLGLRPGWLGLSPGWMAQGGCTDKRTDVQMYGCTNVQKISPFYRTSSPIGAAAQKKARRTDGWTDGPTDRPMNGPTDRQTDKGSTKKQDTFQRPYLGQISIDYKKVNKVWNRKTISYHLRLCTTL